jgi:phosphoribosyl-ATP pyrophosphohydrolase/phosphoribosyl-AMP cyclohydrolase
LLIQNRKVPTCHKGTDTCWATENKNYGFISALETPFKCEEKMQILKKSYVASLFKLGINKIAQKVGEEAVEW